MALLASQLVQHGIDNALLELIRRGHSFTGEIKPPQDIDHGGENLRAGQLDAGGELGVFADLVEIVHLLAIEGGDHPVGV